MFRMMILTTYFKVNEISEIVRVPNNYPIKRVTLSENRLCIASYGGWCIDALTGYEKVGIYDESVFYTAKKVRNGKK